MSGHRSSSSYWARPMRSRDFARARAADVRTMRGDTLQGKRHYRKLYEQGIISLRTAKSLYAEECRAAQAYLLREKRANAFALRDWRERHGNTTTYFEGLKLATRSIKGTALALKLAAAYVRRAAANQIKVSAEPAFPGNPPHSRRGALKRGIRYAVETRSLTAFVGPVASELGDVAWVHEHGGERYGRDYPRRPFMGPVVARCAPYISARFGAVLSAS